MSDGQWSSISLQLRSLAPAVASQWPCILQVPPHHYITVIKHIRSVYTLDIYRIHHILHHLYHIVYIVFFFRSPCCLCYTTLYLYIIYATSITSFMLYYACILPEDILYIYGGYSKEKESGQKKEGRIHEDMWAINLRAMLTTIGKHVT